MKIIILAFLSICLIAILHSCKKITEPEVATIDATEVTAISAVSGGNVINNGGAEVTARGVCWGTSKDPTFNSNPNKTSNGTGNGEFVSNISGLTANTLYYVRAYATNIEGTSYGDNLDFTTQCDSPSAPVVGNITQPTCSATTGSVVLSGMPAAGTWSLTRTPGGIITTGTGTSTTVTGLPAGTTYTFTVTNESGCVSSASGNVVINTQPASPSATTLATSGVGPNTATLNGTVNANGYSATVTFEYGTTISYGSTTTATPSPVTGGSNTAVSAVISGLKSSTLYYYRVKAVNCSDPINGDRLSFSTGFSCGDQLTDPRDGKIYKTLQIGDQCWFVENLNLGTRINGSNNQADNAVIEKYCYNDNESNCNIYGGLYQWDEMMQYTTNESSRGVCPVGWHVPSDNEWKILEMTLGMDQTTANVTGWRGTDEGGKLKAVSSLWTGNNVGATNSSRFNALPSGDRTSSGTYESLGFFTDFWTSTIDTETGSIWYRLLDTEHSTVYRTRGDRKYGTPLRCIKDQN